MVARNTHLPLQLTVTSSCHIKKNITVKFHNLVSTDIKLNHRALEVIVCLFFSASMTFLSEGEEEEEKNSIYRLYRLLSDIKKDWD